MFVNSIRNLMYADGVVSFELAFQAPGKKKDVLEATRIEIPFEQLTQVHGVLNVELEKIGNAHREWLKGQLDAMTKGKPAPAPKPAKKEPPKEPAKPPVGRLLKKI